MRQLLDQGLQRMGLDLPAEIQQREEWFLQELLRWTRRINLTAIVDPAEAVEKHLLDSLSLLPFLQQTGTLLDMGSGAGLPGIPLAIARPKLQVVSIDSAGKKIRFQRHVKRTLGLDNLQPVHARLERLREQLEEQRRFEVVVARAFASLEQILTLADPWLAPAGRILAMKGPEGEAELAGSAELLQRYRLTLQGVERQQLPFSGATRQLLILTKEK